ncbi:hypothetical protein SG09_35590 [Bradyrhizobium ottawaense]|nr:hypothetical protein SG09_35590 [Bradyrhizobium ottawaense]GMO46211.1 hypothetical protein BwSF21_62460 [Bradyrhizobium ottawaense]
MADQKNVVYECTQRKAATWYQARFQSRPFDARPERDLERGGCDDEGGKVWKINSDESGLQKSSGCKRSSLAHEIQRKAAQNKEHDHGLMAGK